MTSELHGSYFRLMTIKHAISKIEWTLNYYITQSRKSSSASGSCSQLETRCGRESHTRPKGLGALMSWGPEKMLIRCNKESHHPAEWTPRPPVEHQENKKTQRDGHKNEGQNIAVSVQFPAPSHTQTLSNPFRTLAIK